MSRIEIWSDVTLARVPMIMQPIGYGVLVFLFIFGIGIHITGGGGEATGDI